MESKRRDFIVRIGQWMIAASMGLMATIGFAQIQPTPPTWRPRVVVQQSPDNTPPPDPKLALKRSLKQIKDNVEKLFMLAEKLKEQVENTDSTTVLSLSFVESTKQIEKLAKQIRNLLVS